MRRRGLASVEEGISPLEASVRLQERKRAERQKETKSFAARLVAAALCILLGNVIFFRTIASSVRGIAAKEGHACATPASLWKAAEVGFVAFADPAVPTLMFPSYAATSGDFVRSYESSTLCPKQVSRMRHKHVQARGLGGKRVNLTDAQATCLQHYVDYFKTRKCD